MHHLCWLRVFTCAGGALGWIIGSEVVVVVPVDRLHYCAGALFVGLMDQSAVEWYSRLLPLKVQLV